MSETAQPSTASAAAPRSANIDPPPSRRSPIVIDRGPDAIEVLAGATIGGYRVQLDKIVSQLRAEIRIRQVVP